MNVLALHCTSSFSKYRASFFSKVKKQYEVENIYRKRNQRLRHQINIIRSIMKYTFILYVFHIAEFSILSGSVSSNNGNTLNRT
jgi:hypothetical protein